MYQVKLKSLAQGIECGMVQLQEPPIEVQMIGAMQCQLIALQICRILAEKKRGGRKKGTKPAYLLTLYKTPKVENIFVMVHGCYPFFQNLLNDVNLT